MAIIKEILIKNFRCIEELKWHPNPGLNCLIGPGDSGKSTILDAIDLTLGTNRNYAFTDSDFYILNTDVPIEIYITLGELDHKLKDMELGDFLRGFDNKRKLIVDEPICHSETVLTIKLTVRDDLQGECELFSKRANDCDIKRHLSWKHRETIHAARLGLINSYDMAWSKRSILNKLSDEVLNTSATLPSLSRATRNIFLKQKVPGIDSVLSKVKEVANKLGVQVGALKALLDTKDALLSNGAISLHNENNVPLRQLGTGSIRLLATGLQQIVNSSSILLIDEAEYGLEPYRITRLLIELGAKNKTPGKQVFITTHSPYVLRELSAQQLNVVKCLPTTNSKQQKMSHDILNLQDTEDEQSTLRACAEAFLAKAVIICEGKSEVGLLRGLDLFRMDEEKPKIFQNLGIYFADGGGDTIMFKRALVFSKLGYPTAILKDSDNNEKLIDSTRTAHDLGIDIFEWPDNQATENMLFMSCPEECITELLNIAIQRKGDKVVDQQILAGSNNEFNLNDCRNNYNNYMRPILGDIAKKSSWFKDIDPYEKIGRTILGPNFKSLPENLQKVILDILRWSTNVSKE